MSRSWPTAPPAGLAWALLPVLGAGAVGLALSADPAVGGPGWRAALAVTAAAQLGWVAFGLGAGRPLGGRAAAAGLLLLAAGWSVTTAQGLALSTAAAQGTRPFAAADAALVTLQVVGALGVALVVRRPGPSDGGRASPAGRVRGLAGCTTAALLTAVLATPGMAATGSARPGGPDPGQDAPALPALPADHEVGHDVDLPAAPGGGHGDH